MKNLLPLRIFGLLFDLNGRELVGEHEDCWLDNFRVLTNPTTCIYLYKSQKSVVFRVVSVGGVTVTGKSTQMPSQT